MSDESKLSKGSGDPACLATFQESSRYIERAPYYLNNLRFRINAIQTRERIGLPFGEHEIAGISKVEAIELERYLDIWKGFHYHSQVIEEHEGALAQASGGIFYLDLESSSFDQQEIGQTEKFSNSIISTSAHQGAVEWFYSIARGILSKISKELIFDHSAESVKDRIEVFNWTDPKCYYDPDIEKIAYYRSSVVEEFEEINLQDDCIKKWGTLISRERILVEAEHSKLNMDQERLQTTKPQEEPALAKKKHTSFKEWYPKAVYLLSKEPNLSDRQIAEKVGVNPSTLSRSEEWGKYREASDRINSSPPDRGYIKKEGEQSSPDSIWED